MTVSDSLFVSCPLIGQSKTKRTFSQGTFLKDEPLDLGGKVIWIFFYFLYNLLFLVLVLLWIKFDNNEALPH